eukprot:TRINITY_DN26630_c0_g1_i1.p1 TRINITY_DN26630_c0_g1~~TRINITY_DN26630_c0_g1_i1.p1  ORF type:complete len:302 (+),score=37.51 TRINITY_DN26630_c0_g1_i1:52-957(+)
MLALNRRVIFLDIDGVLNGLWGKKTLPFASFDESCMSRLKLLLERSGASIVLSTPWRKHLSYLNDVFANYGLLGNVSPRSGPERPIHSQMRTPAFADPRRRDFEIVRWLAMNQKELGVDSWVVLDSMNLLCFPETQEMLEGRVVCTDPCVGLTDEDVEKALKILLLREARLGSTTGDVVGGEGIVASTSRATPRDIPSVPLPIGGILSDLRCAMDPMDDVLCGGMQELLSTLNAGPRRTSCEEVFLPPPQCSDGHHLRRFSPPCTGFCCETCGADLDEGVVVWRCDLCDGITFCKGCVAKS